MSGCGGNSKQRYSKSALALLFFALLTLTYLFLIGTLDDVRSHFLLQFPPSDPLHVYRTLSPLRVYMYDLPPRFNVGIFHRNTSDHTPVTPQTFPPWPHSSGLGKQHSVEYWMMASLLMLNHQGEDQLAMEAVRVSDPDAAHVFFLPFFSSLSFNTYDHHMLDPETEHDKKLQVLIHLIHHSILNADNSLI